MERRRCVFIFLFLLILTVANVKTEFDCGEGLSVYDIELWHEIRNTIKNNETNTLEIADLTKSECDNEHEKLFRRNNYNSNEIIDDEEEDEIDNFNSHEYLESNRKFFYDSINGVICDWLVDCDESFESKTVRPKSKKPKKSVSSQTSTSSSFNLNTESKLQLSGNDENKSNEKKCPYIPKGYQRFQCSPHAYKFYKESVCWAEAQSRCQKESADLLVIENGAQYDIVIELAKREMIKENTPIDFHVGFHRLTVAHSWITIHGDQLPFEKWLTTSQINNGICGGFTIFSDRLAGFKSHNCNKKFYYICEIKLSSECK